MGLVTPGIGLLFWMLLSFTIVLFVLKKYAWGPIVKALHDRENSIAEALATAEKAREEMAKLKADNEKIIAQANEERKKILSEAYEQNKHIVAEAKAEAKAEADKILEAARETIEHEKNMALSEIKHLMADLSIDIAKKVLQRELSDENKQKEYVNNILDDIKLN
jgi:F-type H+-transporting ATPase subunit b